MSEEEKEEIYEMTAQILGLGYSLEDAKERLDSQVVVNDMIEEPVLSDWSHLDKNEVFLPGSKQRLIDKLTQEIKSKERYRRY